MAQIFSTLSDKLLQRDVISLMKLRDHANEVFTDAIFVMFWLVGAVVVIT